MNLRVKAIISGIVIEGMLLVLTFSGIEFGHSCKPGGFGLVLIMLHYPALILEPYLPPFVPFLVAVALSVVVWSFVAYVLIRLLRLRRK